MLLVYSLACGGVLLLAFLLSTDALGVNRQANRWLGIFLACVGCVLLGRLLPGTALAVEHPSLLGWLELTRLAMAPAFYLSVVQFTAPDRPLQWRDGFHFLPWLLFGLAMMPALLGHETTGPALLPVAAWVARLLVFATPKVQAIGYWLAAYLALHRHQRHVLQLTAQPEPMALQWLKQVLWGAALLVGLWLNEQFFHVGWVLALTPAGYLGAVFYLAHYALRQPEVFAFAAPVRADIQELWQQEPPAQTDSAPSAPAKQARLSPSQVAYWQQRLHQLLETEKVYLEADLNLPALAQRIGLTTHELSYVLNEGVGANFFQFINAYRVAEAQRLLASAQHQHLSMVGIAFEAGFSSKTTFNTAFKKGTGLTPSQFLQQVRAGSAPSPDLPGSAWLPSMGSVG